MLVYKYLTKDDRELIKFLLYDNEGKDYYDIENILNHFESCVSRQSAF